MRTAHRTLATLLALLMPATLPAREDWFVVGSGLQSLIVLGSRERRSGFMVAVQRVRPERWLDDRSTPGLLVLEAYYQWSNRINALPEAGPVRQATFGFLALARYEDRRRVPGTFVEFGWGLSFSDGITADLPSRFNSVPTVGGGFILPAGRREVYLGLRFMHFSNAGTKGSNNGQNQLHLTVGLRL